MRDAASQGIDNGKGIRPEDLEMVSDGAGLFGVSQGRETLAAPCKHDMDD